MISAIPSANLPVCSRPTHADHQRRYAEIRLRNRGLGCKIVTYALENQAVADYTAANITYDEFDHPSFDCICRGELRGRYTLMVPGLHNVSNALAAIALADELQLPENAIHEGFATFRGTDRRFQYKVHTTEQR